MIIVKLIEELEKVVKRHRSQGGKGMDVFLGDYPYYVKDKVKAYIKSHYNVISSDGDMIEFMY